MLDKDIVICYIRMQQEKADFWSEAKYGFKKIKTILDIGETIAVEFKRCGNGIESDVYETVCSFLNRFGGDIF